MPVQDRYLLHPQAIRSMPPPAWEAFKTRLIRRARAEQAAAIHDAAAQLRAAVLGRLWAGFRLVARVYFRRSRVRRAAAELNTFSDHELKDIGVRRCEIEAWVRSPPPDLRCRQPLIPTERN